MQQHPKVSFPIAEAAVGYSLTTQSSALARQVELSDRWVLEITEIWSGVVQKVRHIHETQNVSGVLYREGQYEVLLEDEGTYLVERRGQGTEVIESGGSFPVSKGAVVHVRTGTRHVLYRVVPAGRRVGFDPMEWIDGPFLGVLALAFMLGLSFLTMVLSLPGQPVVQAQDIGDRFARVMLAKQHPPRHKPKPVRRVMKKQRTENTSGTESRLKRSKNMQSNRMGPRIQRDDTIGIIGAIKRGNMLTPFQMDKGLIQNISTKPYGNASGDFRLGTRSRGFGSGPGVESGGGGALTSGLNVGSGGALNGRCTEPDGLCEKEVGRVSVDSDTMITVGSLSRAEVDEVVKSHLRRIKYCYQRQMQVNPSLSGKVTTRFTVSNDGSVGTARVVRSSIENEAVERCVVRTVFGMQFPKPRGGGHVIVTYPFTFEAS